MSYRLVLDPTLYGLHPVYRLSMLKRYHFDSYYTIKWDSIMSDKHLQYKEEPIDILYRDVCKLGTKEIMFVRVLWMQRPVEKDNWETKKDM